MRNNRVLRGLSLRHRMSVSPPPSPRPGLAVIVDVDDPGVASRLAWMLRVARVPVTTSEAIERPALAGGEPIVIVGYADAQQCVGVVGRLRARAPAVGIVVCMDDVQAFDETFLAGADAWVSTRVDASALAVVLNSVQRPAHGRPGT